VRDRMAWQERGRCRDLDTELFYPPLESETPRQRRARESAAKAVCSGCPVRGECLAWALASDERLGVWGGKSERERELLAGHRRRRTLQRLAVR
jgi:WhiB family redox-sensing transcriptional regulator